MILRHAHALLLIAAAACLALAAALAGAQWAKPVPPITEVPPAEPAAAATTTAALPNFSAVKGRPLRRPLIDAEPVAAAPATPGPEFKLLGTVTEPGHSYAIFQVAGGRVEVCQVGETAGVAQVTSIGPRRVTIRYNGQTRRLSLPEPGGRLGL